jgi:hypothetical protein
MQSVLFQQDPKTEKPLLLTGNEDAFHGVMAVVLGLVRWRLRRDSSNSGWANVLNAAGDVIGGASQIYANGGWAVHTKPFAGYVGPDEITFVDADAAL